MNKYQLEIINIVLERIKKFPDLYKPLLNKPIEEIQKDYALLQELVNKGTPMKVKVIDEPDLHYIYYCPSCGATLMVDRNKHPKHLFNYCGKCGQKLDWEEKK